MAARDDVVRLLVRRGTLSRAAAGRIGGLRAGRAHRRHISVLICPVVSSMHSCHRSAEVLPRRRRLRLVVVLGRRLRRVEGPAESSDAAQRTAHRRGAVQWLCATQILPGRWCCHRGGGIGIVTLKGGHGLLLLLSRLKRALEWQLLRAA